MDDFFYGSHVHGDDICLDDYYMDEKWKFIREAPDYMVSNKGRVWSCKSQKLLKLKKLDSHGHLGVCLCENGRLLYRYIHRLVADAFIPNPNHYPIVRHLMDNPEYNDENELAWGTQRDNTHDSMRNGTARPPSVEAREKSYTMSRTPIRAIDLETGRILVFRGQGEASRILGVPQANIWKVLNNHRPHAQGYHFEYIRGGDDRE